MILNILGGIAIFGGLFGLLIWNNRSWAIADHRKNLEVIHKTCKLSTLNDEFYRTVEPLKPQDVESKEINNG